MSSALKWRTAISKVEKNKVLIRGYQIEELMEKVDFGEAFFLLLKGRPASREEARLMNAILVACIDHSITVPSALSARIVYSGAREAFQAAVAGGILSIGDLHGGAIEQAAKLFQEGVKEAKGKSISSMSSAIVEEFKQAGRRVPGYGHPIHTSDPRVKKLKQLAEESGISGDHVRMASAIEEALEKSQGRRIPLNIDGMVGALISDMGFDWRLGKGFFILSRCAGIIAHVYEEGQREGPWRHLGPEEYVYDGEPERPLNLGKP